MPTSGRTSHIRRLLAREPTRFLLVGACNTAVGFALYSLLWLTLGQWVGYLACLYLSYACAIVLAHRLYRTFVFRSAERGVVHFLRFSAVYLVSLAINTVVLPALVVGLHLQPILAQATALIITTACSYAGHKFFSFRTPRTQRRQP